MKLWVDLETIVFIDEYKPYKLIIAELGHLGHYMICEKDISSILIQVSIVKQLKPFGVYLKDGLEGVGKT